MNPEVPEFQRIFIKIYLLGTIFGYNHLSLSALELQMSVTFGKRLEKKNEV